MNDKQQQLFGLVQMQLSKQSIVKEEDIVNTMTVFRVLNPVSDDEAEEVKNELMASLQIKMDVGACLKEKNHVSWYYNAKKEINPVYWERYKKYLNLDQGFSTEVIKTMDISTDEIMDMLGDPRQGKGYSIKGLIIGDVQSGKTSTYTALVNKAADAGYKIIILLTGTIEKLRKQTQGRLDAGFIGLDSSALAKDKKNIYIGVGNIDPSVSGWSITSTTNDFNKNIASQFSGQLKSITAPVLFVLKKNKSIMEKLYEWLKKFNQDSNGKVNAPMLLIDDEADNASVNTRKEDDTPTAINKSIRMLLSLFTHSNYVAFTATPYANIFINPDTDDDMLNDDLFPGDFIYALEPPTNYIGAVSIFNSEGKHHYMLKENSDCSKYLPEKHKKDDDPQIMPESLKEAIVSFFITNAVRDLRGHKSTHRTMLINISRFINVQEKVKRDIEDFVRSYQTEIRNYCHLGKKALERPDVSYIKYVYDKNFATITKEQLNEEEMFSWEAVQEALDEAVSPIVVRTVNGGNAAKNLNYDDNEDEGLRLIAVGGYSLSRGLTLEGLNISYFYRNSKMYDTLMQMGRWFGYRNHYADLCQIWMSKESADWYEHISMASEELKRDVRRMTDADLTPREFGLSVRNDINSLLVTAINKMRYTEQTEVIVGLDGSAIDTPNFYKAPKINRENYELVTEWVDNLYKKGYEPADVKKEDLALKNVQFLRVDKSEIIDLIKRYNSHYWNLNFNTESIVKALNKNDENMNSWDVLIATGDGKAAQFGSNLLVKPIIRQFYLPHPDKNGISIVHRRLANVNYAKGGLTKNEEKAIREKAIELRPDSKKDSSLNQDEYFNTGIKRRPLLVIMPVLLNPSDDDKEMEDIKKKIVSEYANNNNLWVGLEIGIPSIGNKKRITYRYTINMIKVRELLNVDDDYIEETGDDELYE